MRNTMSATTVKSMQRLTAVWADISNGQRRLIEFNRPTSKKR